jgi:hypothetical protein
MKKSAVRPRTVRSPGGDSLLVGLLAVMVAYALVDGLLRVAMPLGA